jgi:carboxymethylenebutenolidase
VYCEDLVASGFRVVAPDLYDARQAGSDEEAGQAPRGARPSGGGRKSRRALEPARTLSVPVALVGFSTGGWYALGAAAAVAADAAVAYSAIHDANRVNYPVLCHFAKHDEWPEDERPALFLNRLRECRVDVEAETYPGTQHGFANADIPAYDEAAACDAWRATRDFLQRVLTSSRDGRS